MLAPTCSEAIAETIQFHAREDHAHVPHLHVEDGLPLGNWVATIRIEYRRGKLSQKRIATLGAIPGWTCEPREKRERL